MTRHRSSEPDPQLSFLLPIETPPFEWSKADEAEIREAFEAWWLNDVWLKRDKPAAYKAYLKAIRTGAATPQLLIDGAHAYARYLERNPTRAVKYPQGWISGSRWEDDLRDDTRSAARARTAAFVEAAHSVGAGAAIRRRV